MVLRRKDVWQVEDTSVPDGTARQFYIWLLVLLFLHILTHPVSTVHKTFPNQAAKHRVHTDWLTAWITPSVLEKWWNILVKKRDKSRTENREELSPQHTYGRKERYSYKGTKIRQTLQCTLGDLALNLVISNTVWVKMLLEKALYPSFLPRPKPDGKIKTEHPKNWEPPSKEVDRKVWK